MDRKEYKPRKRYNNKPRFNKKTQDNRKQSTEPVVVYTTKSEGPEKLADWQLKLQAMSDLYDKRDDENYKHLVEVRYQELWHKQNK